MNSFRTAADVIAGIMADLSRQGIAVLEVARTGYGLHLWVAARPPGKPPGVRLYLLRRSRGRWSVVPSSPGAWGYVPPRVLEAVRG